MTITPASQSRACRGPHDNHPSKPKPGLPGTPMPKFAQTNISLNLDLHLTIPEYPLKDMNWTRAVLSWFRLAVCVPVLLGTLVVAQDRQKGDQIPPGSTAQNDESTFRVNVRLVNVFTTVTDSHGAP